MTFWKRDPALVSTTPAVDGSPISARIELLLLRDGLLSDESIGRARLVQQETGERFESVVTRLGLTSELAMAQLFAREAGLPVIDGASMPQAPVGNEPLSSAFLHDVRMLPIAMGDQHVVVAVANPFDRLAEDAIRFLFGRPARFVVALPSDLDSAIERLYGSAEDALGLDDAVDEDDLERLKDLASDAPVIRAVNRLIAEAAETHASDIHVEPADDRLIVRFRIDGVLQERPALPAAMRAPLVSRIKVMAGLNIAEKRLPQDGRLRLAVRGQEIDLRVATAPSMHGESVVMRLLDRSHLSLDFATLGFDAALTEDFLRVLGRPHGIVLVTGPTGSGKTTTLYATLSQLNQPGRKLLTVEDPVEYRLSGIVQTQVNPAIGFTFSSALRSFLRQDPDVMMVGEIRDGETAQIAVQAALTGHVILSTLHTNSAAGAVSRLADMGVEPFLLSSVLNAVLAQRLVRRLCPDCREPAPFDAAAAHELAEAHGLQLPETFYHGRGCGACRGSGYRGRVALIELLIITDEMARLILNRADDREIALAAAKAGMRSLLGDGLRKAGAGETTLAEVLRVANEG